MKPFSHYLKITSSITFGWIATSISSACAQQIIADPTVLTNVVPQGQLYEIMGGTRSEGNLFHSFDQFSVDTGSTAYFNNSLDIQNIISRVTGGSISNIDGLIRANGTANLFLINPNGIVFGPNARLTIGGSFLASTANSFIFPEGTQFSATSPQAPPLLSINVPIGLQFGSNAARIQVQGSNLEVPAGQTLALVGGNVSLESGSLRALGGRVELGGLAGEGAVEWNNGTFTFPDGVARADVLLNNQAFVEVAAAGGGSIAINARNIQLEGSSRLLSGIAPGLGSPGAISGDITLDATGAVTVESSAIANNVGAIDTNDNIIPPTAIGDGGDILIKAESVSLQNASLDTGTFGQGNAGNIGIAAERTIAIADSDIFSDAYNQNSDVGGEAGLISFLANDSIAIARSFITVQSKGFATTLDSLPEGDIILERVPGQAGGIFMAAGTLSITDGSRLISSAFTGGYAGEIFLLAEDTVAIADSQIFSDANDQISGFGGLAGSIGIAAVNSISLQNSQITAESYGFTGTDSEPSGQIALEAGSIAIGSESTLSTRLFNQGVAGNVFIQANNDDIAITDSYIFSDAYNENSNVGGQAGLIAMLANDTVAIARSLITAESAGVATTEDSLPEEDSILQGTAGQGGGIVMVGRTISITEGTQLTSTAFDSGYAGAIVLVANEQVEIADSEIFSDANNEQNNSGGLAGYIGIGASNSISIRSSQITAESFGITGEDFESSGEIEFEAGSISIDRGSLVSTTIFGEGFAGDVYITAEDTLSLTNQSSIESNSQGAGDAGSIDIGAGSLVLMRRNSQIATSANTEGTFGLGGDITINTRFLVGVSEENNDIIANANNGPGGFIQINAQGVYGLRFQPQLTLRSDITAFSELSPELNGVVEINTPDVDPSSGLAELPSDVEDASQLIARDLCRPKEKESSFIVTGRGGIPSNPREMLAPDATVVEWVTGETEEQTSRDVEQRIQSSSVNENQQLTQENGQIVEAQGWSVAENGTVILTANPSTVTPHSSRFTSPGCQARG